MKTVIALGLVYGLLAGCATDAQRQASAQHEIAQREAQRAAYRERVNGQCRAYGFADGTPEFRNCLMQVDMAMQQQDAQMRGVVLQQMLQQQQQSLPLCSSLAPGMAGYYRAQGRCR